MVHRYFKNTFPFTFSLLSASLSLAMVQPLSLSSSSLFADETAAQEEQKTAQKTKEELLNPENIRKISETYGHFVAKSLDNPLLKLDFNAVIQGMNDAKDGKACPMTEQEYEEAITQLQELAFQETALKNAKEAEEFLAENAKAPGVQEIEPGKLQILIEQEGDGEAVTESVMPVVHYTGSYLNGTVFGSSKDSNEPIAISLNQTIPGFKKGVLGMKVGEKRRIFIHPDLGYGTSGQLMPNALLIFDIELVRLEPLPKEESLEDLEDSEGEEVDLSMTEEDLLSEDIEGSEDSSDDADDTEE